MKFVKSHWPTLVTLVIVIAAVVFRFGTYGNPRLSIANNDTETYVSSSEVSLFSIEAFTGRRLFSKNLIYQIFKPKQGYEILANGSGSTTKREAQETFTGIVLFQTALSLLGWGLLILAATSQIRQSLLKILAAVILMAFAFTPQIVDWDSVLSSEALTFSFFAIQFALLILLVFRLEKTSRPDRSTIGLIILWVIVVFFWSFLKDTNLYNLLADGLLLAAALCLKPFRKQKLLIGVLALLAAFFLLGWVTSAKSPRSQVSLLHIYQVSIISSPERYEYMKAEGMPEPDLKSPEFNDWFVKNAKNAYLKYMITHPGIVARVYLRDSLSAFSENLQPYFSAEDIASRSSLVRLGNALHPANSSPIIMDAILLFGIWMIAIKKAPTSGLPWAWLATWVFLSASLNMFITIFGDTYGLTRHALTATLIFRLFMWLFAIVLIDLSLAPERRTQLSQTV